MNQVSGLQIDEAALKKSINGIIQKEVTRQKQIGQKANKDLREKATMQWFSDIMKFKESRYNMMKSLCYKTTEKFHNGLIELEFISWVDASRYNIHDTRMYQQKDIYPIDHFQYIVGDLQWNQGILGLPQQSSQTDWVNYHFHQGKSLSSLTQHVFKYNWVKRLNQYATKEFGGKVF